mmetsp:Transcript_34052/g.58835  ORF Transcript_34052/g.58835 Transcript_34052/m.58835 type:complete len:232 (-) Transcript_34052:453-1148(-)
MAKDFLLFEDQPLTSVGVRTGRWRPIWVPERWTPGGARCAWAPCPPCSTTTSASAALTGRQWAPSPGRCARRTGGSPGWRQWRCGTRGATTRRPATCWRPTASGRRRCWPPPRRRRRPRGASRSTRPTRSGSRPRRWPTGWRGPWPAAVAAAATAVADEEEGEEGAAAAADEEEEEEREVGPSRGGLRDAARSGGGSAAAAAAGAVVAAAAQQGGGEGGKREEEGSCGAYY